MATLDSHLPRYRVNEVHSIAVAVAPETALRHALALEVGSDRIVRALFRLRGVRGIELPIERFVPEILGLAVVERAPTRYVATGDVRGIRIGLSFEAEATSGGSRLSTETRVAGGGLRFRLYSLAIAPFSALIRRRWLRAAARGAASAGDEFVDYALSQLPAAPARVLEVGCGREGGIAPALAAAGYDVLAIDPDAPEGPLFRRVTLEELDDPGPFDAVVAGRVLHHVDPLGPALDTLAGLAPLLIVDELASERVDRTARDWHRDRYLSLASPDGPADLDKWAVAHPGLHSSEVLRAELDTRYETRDFRWRPYLYRWLHDPDTKALEEDAIENGVLRPIGFRYTGVATR